MHKWSKQGEYLTKTKNLKLRKEVNGTKKFAEIWGKYAICILPFSSDCLEALLKGSCRDKRFINVRCNTLQLGLVTINLILIVDF